MGNVCFVNGKEAIYELSIVKVVLFAVDEVNGLLALTTAPDANTEAFTAGLAKSSMYHAFTSCRYDKYISCMFSVNHILFHVPRIYGPSFLKWPN